MCMNVLVPTQYPWKPEKDVRSPVAGVSGSCLPHNVGAWNKTHVLNPAQELPNFNFRYWDTNKIQ